MDRYRHSNTFRKNSNRFRIRDALFKVAGGVGDEQKEGYTEMIKDVPLTGIFVNDQDGSPILLQQESNEQ